MKATERIFWHQGLFLQPQHFQILDYNSIKYFADSISLTNSYSWGISNFELDLDALSRNIANLNVFNAIFNDGTPVYLNENAKCSPRDFSKVWQNKDKPFFLYIGFKKAQEHDNASVLKQDDNSFMADSRFIYNNIPELKKDEYSDGPDANVEKMYYNLKIFFENELDKSSSYMIMPFAKLIFEKSQIQVDLNFIQPIYNISSSKHLYSLLESIKLLLISRTKRLQEFKSPSSLKNANMNSNYFFYMLALQTLNRYLPVVKMYFDDKKTHPRLAATILSQLIGELSLFTDRIDVFGITKNGNKLLDDYIHANPYMFFESANILIQELLEELVIGPEYLIEFEKNNDYYTCKISNDVFASSHSYYLLIQSNKSDTQLLEEFKNLNKIGTNETIETLINRALPGIDILNINSQPLGLPKKENIKYFKLDIASQIWLDIKRYQNISIYYDDIEENITMQLAIIKEV